MTSPAKPAQAAVKTHLTDKTARRRRKLASSAAVVCASAAPGRRNDLSPKLKIVRLGVEELRPANRRVRRAAPAQTKRLIDIIKVTGVCAPILIDGQKRVIDGHSVLEAARALAIETIPCILIEHLTRPEIEFLKVALNRSAECGEWDMDVLKPVLIDLREEGFDLADTAFSIPEIDAIILDEPQDTNLSEDEVPEPPKAPVSCAGDLWALGSHRILCGDSTLADSYSAVLGAEKAAAVFTDPPWNIPIKGFVSSKHEDFKMGAGEMTAEAFSTFISAFTKNCVDVLEDCGVVYICIDWRSSNLIVEAAIKAGLQFINMAVWSKGSGGMGGLYRSAHELISIFCNGSSPRVNNVQLGKHGRDRTNVWTYPGANRRGSSAGDALKHHPTPKPVELVHDAIIDVTSPREIVLDPFLGSGTTLLACEQSGRYACGIELDPAYVDVCIRRWEALTGLSAVHAETGLTFAELQEQRDVRSLGDE